jgi:hypothetical protein
MLLLIPSSPDAFEIFRCSHFVTMNLPNQWTPPGVHGPEMKWIGHLPHETLTGLKLPETSAVQLAYSDQTSTSDKLWPEDWMARSRLPARCV